LLGRIDRLWQAVPSVLTLFGPDVQAARAGYRQFVAIRTKSTIVPKGSATCSADRSLGQHLKAFASGCFAESIVERHHRM
jgi:hypothetical protein